MTNRLLGNHSVIQKRENGYISNNVEPENADAAVVDTPENPFQTVVFRPRDPGPSGSNDGATRRIGRSPGCPKSTGSGPVTCSSTRRASPRAISLGFSALTRGTPRPVPR